MSGLSLLFAALVFLGHAALWVAYFNRVHGLGLPEYKVRLLSGLGHVVFGLLPPAVFLAANRFGWFRPELLFVISGGSTSWLYLLPWAAAGVGAIALWSIRLVRQRKASLRHQTRTTLVDVAQRLRTPLVCNATGRLLTCIPGNQMLKLAVREKTLRLSRLPTSLDGLSIAHLSDFHFTGTIGVEYFKEVVRQTNDLQPDLIAISGDLVDEIECCDWIPQTLGRLAAPLGAYFVLGNHDLFHGRQDRLRRAMIDAGIVDLGASWRCLDATNAKIIVAGNELPWSPPHPDLSDCPKRSDSPDQLRILIAHTPDQITWARRHDFDLMLAGHTHGGQIRLPLIGAILSPSLYGVKYACGVFHESPTWMHVSCGISGDFPLRLNCPPELVKLVLRPA